jgi:hypothetical protein
LPLVELLPIVIFPVAAPVAVGLNCTCNVIDCCGFSVAGKLPLTIVNPAPAMAAEFTVTADVPVEVSVNAIALAVFTVTLPKPRLVGLTVNCGLVAAAEPAPLNAIAVELPLVELLPTVIFPLAAPVAVGLNCTRNVIDCCGFSVAGKVPPTIVNPAPAMAAEFTVTAEVPVEVSTKDSTFAVFTVTLPKPRLVGLTVNWGLVAATPVPLNAMTVVLPLVELLPTVIFPVKPPVAVGLNCTCNVILRPEFIVTGKLPPTMVKPAPEIAAEFTVTAEVPVEVSVNAIAFAVFTVTLPKPRLVGLTDNCGLVVAAAPVPLSTTAVVPPLAALLLSVSRPLADPTAVGLNCTCNVVDWFGLSVVGSPPPTIAKPAPLIAAELIVSGKLPVDFNVSVRVVAEFTATLPKPKTVSLKVNCADLEEDP